MKSKGKGLRTDTKRSEEDFAVFPDFKSFDHGRVSRSDIEVLKMKGLVCATIDVNVTVGVS